MFSVLAVGYLFLGGAGAGAIAVASILDLAWVRGSIRACVAHRHRGGDAA